MSISGPHNFQTGALNIASCSDGGQTPPTPSSSILDPNNFTPGGLMLPGPQGIQGEQGPAGSEGASGASGYSGMRGPTGLSGTSGTSGFSGVSGISGFSGFSGSGTSGFSGINGSNGTSGFSGTDGISGFSGTNGTSGFSGFSGNSGFSGFSGAGSSLSGLTTNFLTKAASSTTIANSDFSNPSTGTIKLPDSTSGAGTTLTIEGSNAQSGSGLNGGNLVLKAGGKDGAGTDGTVNFFTPNAQHLAKFGAYPGEPLYGLVWFGETTPSAANWMIAGGIISGTRYFQFLADHIYFHGGSASNPTVIFQSTINAFGTPIAFTDSANATSTKDSGVARNSSGVIRSTDGSSGIGAFLSKYQVVPKTADYPVLALESRVVFTNTGAGGLVIFTLPTPVSGLAYTFQVKTNQNLRIFTGTASLIYDGTNVSTATTGYIQSNTVGSSIEIVCDGTDWTAKSVTGTWAAT